MVEQARKLAGTSGCRNVAWPWVSSPPQTHTGQERQTQWFLSLNVPLSPVPWKWANVSSQGLDVEFLLSEYSEMLMLFSELSETKLLGWTPRPAPVTFLSLPHRTPRWINNKHTQINSLWSPGLRNFLLIISQDRTDSIWAMRGFGVCKHLIWGWVGYFWDRREELWPTRSAGWSKQNCPSHWFIHFHLQALSRCLKWKTGEFYQGVITSYFPWQPFIWEKSVTNRKNRPVELSSGKMINCFNLTEIRKFLHLAWWTVEKSK